MKKLGIVIFAIVLITIVPYIGSWLFYNGNFPDHFFYFPPESAPPKPGFNLTVFIVLLMAILFFVVLYLFPGLFGFKKPMDIPKENSTKKLPYWFWLGAVVSLIDGIVLFAQLNNMRFIINLGYIPIIWGFLFMTDGAVYKRTNGNSILAKRPVNILIMALCSAFAWAYFEYLSMFVEINWYYPNGNLITQLEFYIYAIVGGGVLVPFAFEGYMLMSTFKWLRRKYSYGPKIVLKRSTQTIIVICCLVPMFFVSSYPFILFPILWLGPAIVLSILFDMAGLWTPFKPVATHGNWTPLALIALGEIIIGFIHEGVNYFSASHHPFSTMVPGYWKYSIPYVDKFHIFEMPAEGIFGYLPYGIYNWIVWIGFAFMFKVKTQFDSEGEFFAKH